MSIAGIWQNEYGSRMTLTVRGSVVEGVYASTTGSTGEFSVTGWACENAATTEVGQPVALSIKWHSLVDGEADASWNWASAMGGQINIVDGREAMVLSHFMIASRSFEGLCKHGVYVDKLTFYRISDVPKPFEKPCFIEAKADDPMSGSWITSDGSLMDISVRYESEYRFGHLSGFLHFDGMKLALSGFTDVKAGDDQLDLQATSIVVHNALNNSTIAMGGFLKLKDGALELQVLTNKTTGGDVSYTQSQISFLRFTRKV